MTAVLCNNCPLAPHKPAVYGVHTSPHTAVVAVGAFVAFGDTAPAEQRWNLPDYYVFPQYDDTDLPH